MGAVHGPGSANTPASSAPREGELACLDHCAEFMNGLEVANHLRNDLIHALPTAQGFSAEDRSTSWWRETSGRSSRQSELTK